MKAVLHSLASACCAILFGSLVLGAGPVGAASRVTVTLYPPNFELTESAQLTITVTGDEDAAPLIPRVPGLIINPDGQSSQIRQVNGAVTAIFARTYRVTAKSEGVFTIPPIQIGSMTTTPVTVRVGAAAAAAGGGSPSRVPATGTANPASPPNPDHDSEADVAKALREAMPTLKVVLPRTHLYVGELVPIQIKAYFRTGVGASAEVPPAAVSDAFTVSGLDKRAVKTEENLGGVSYNVLTWNSVLGALKSGDYPIALEFPVTLSIDLPDADSDMGSRLRALFGARAPGAFMDDSVFGGLFGRVVHKSVTLKADPTPVKVLPLPVEGRPANFSGAVGQFQLAGELAPTAGSVGDPLTFKLTVTGKGNLSRVSSDALAGSSQWRVYRAESKLTTDDESGLQGFKTFSQPVVPLEAGQLVLPAVSFSYFDPEAGRYVTRATQPILVTVTPAAGSPQAASSLQAGGPVTGTTPGAAADSLAPDVLVTGGYRATLESPVLRPWFIASALTPLILMLSAVTLVRRHQLRSGDPTLLMHAARLAAVRINLESMAAAMNRGDATAFFTAARHALQEKLADLWQIPAESVDPKRFAERLSATESAELQAIFAMAEKAIYAGESPAPQALQEWQRRVHQQMDRLEALT